MGAVLVHTTGSAAARREAILIAGATASGKSALALRLAERLGGRIINADSMQVYRDLRILTARPSEADLQRAPHRLYGTVDGAEAFSVSRWLAAAAAELVEARRDGVLPILVGGTGLYFKALTQGLSDIPAVPEHIRSAVRAWANKRSAEDLHRELARRDPATASRLRSTDTQRLVRAIEVNEATGESLAAYQRSRTAPLIDMDVCAAFTIAIERDTSRSRVDARFDTMIEGGALDEVRSLLQRQLDPALPVMRAIGVPSLARHLDGETDAASAITEAKTATRQYIKRQETFFRHQLPGFRPMTAEAVETALSAGVHS